MLWWCKEGVRATLMAWPLRERYSYSTVSCITFPVFPFFTRDLSNSYVHIAFISYSPVMLATAVANCNRSRENCNCLLSSRMRSICCLIFQCSARYFLRLGSLGKWEFSTNFYKCLMYKICVNGTFYRVTFLQGQSRLSLSRTTKVLRVRAWWFRAGSEVAQVDGHVNGIERPESLSERVSIVTFSSFYAFWVSA